MAQYNKTKRGFSLPELLAVMAIMAILAAASSPFIRGYIRDAGNDKAKSLMQLIAQASKTLKADYPHTVFDSAAINSASVGGCVVSTDPSVKNSPALLRSCNYLQNVNWAAYKYDFFVDYKCCSDIPASTDVVLSCMKGTATAGDYTSAYCAWVDKYGTVADNKI